MNTTLVTIRSFSDGVEANIAKGQLEASGIKCFIKNEAYLSARPLHNVAVGGFELQVTEKDAEKALEIVNSV